MNSFDQDGKFPGSGLAKKVYHHVVKPIYHHVVKPAARESVDAVDLGLSTISLLPYTQYYLINRGNHYTDNLLSITDPSLFVVEALGLGTDSAIDLVQKAIGKNPQGACDEGFKDHLLPLNIGPKTHLYGCSRSTGKIDYP